MRKTSKDVKMTKVTAETSRSIARTQTLNHNVDIATGNRKCVDDSNLKNRSNKQQFKYQPCNPPG